jgi:hypothetical protein
MLSKEQRVNNAVYASAWRDHRCLRLWDKMARLGAGQPELQAAALPLLGDGAQRRQQVM